MAAFPFFCLRMLRLRKLRSEWIFFAIALLCCLIQGCVVVFSQFHASGPGVVSDLTLYETVKYWILGLLAQPVAIFFLGSGVAKMALSSVLICAICICWIIVMMSSCMVLWNKSSEVSRRLSFLFFLFSVLFFLAQIYRFAKCPDYIVKCGLSRYFFLPFVFAAVSIAICVCGKGSYALRIALGSLIFGSIMIGSIGAYKVPDRLHLHWDERMAELRCNGRTVIPISPGDEWTLVLKRQGSP